MRFMVRKFNALMAVVLILGCLAPVSAWAQVNGGGTPPATGPTIDGNCTFHDIWEGAGWSACGLAQGLFSYSHTDLKLAGPMPITLTRVYRSQDVDANGTPINGPFGYGTNFLYNMFLYSPSQAAGQSITSGPIDLVLADGSQISFPCVSYCGSYTTATFQAVSVADSGWMAAAIYYNSALPGWTLARQDGTIYSFGLGAPLQSISDRYGNKVTITRAGGQTGNIQQISATPSGRSLVFSYDAYNHVSSVTDNSITPARIINYVVNSSTNQLTSVKDTNGNTTAYGYDTRGGLTQNITSITDPLIKQTNIGYTSTGLLSSIAPPLNNAWGFSFTGAPPNISAVQITDANSNVENLTFASGYVMQDAKAVGTSVAETTNYNRYSSHHLLLDKIDTLIVDGSNRDTHYGFDAMGRLTSLTTLYGTPDAATTVMVYYGWQYYFQVQKITDPLQLGSTQFVYNTNGFLTQKTDPMGNVTNYTPNSYGQVATTAYNISLAPNGTTCGTATQVTTTNAYYPNGDLQSVTSPLGNVTAYQYDGAGRRKQQTEAMGNSFKFTYDGNDAIISATDVFANQSTAYQRDPNENITTYTDANNNNWGFTFDARNRQTRKCDPTNRCYSSSYDGMNNLTSVTSAGANVSNYHFDALNRKTFEGYGATGSPPSYVRQATYAYDPGNRLTQAVDSTTGTYTRGWDGNDRLKTETTPNGTVTYCYDRDGRRTAMSLNGSDACSTPTVTYIYNANNDLTSISQTGFGTASYTYDPHRQQCSLALPNGTSQAYSYDQDSRLTAIAYAKGTTSLGNLTYGYDADGRRTQVGGSFASVVIPSGQPPFGQTGPFTYRANNTVQYAWTSHTAETSDWAGDNQGDGNNSYVYDVRGELNQAASALLTVTVTNDPFGRKQKAVTNSPARTTTYLYDGTNVIQEQITNGGNATQMVGLRLDEHLARTDSAGNTRYFFTDAQGSTIALVDGNGTIQTQYSYGPFGQTVAIGQTSDNPYQFVGHAISSLGSMSIYDFRARYYDTTMGRFLSSDPEGFSGGSHNLYAYAGSSPLNMLDPSGKWTIGGFPVGIVSAGWSNVIHNFKAGGNASAQAAAAANAAIAEAAQSSNSGASGTGGAGGEQVASTNNQGFGDGSVDDPYAVSAGQMRSVTAEPGTHVYGVSPSYPSVNVDVYCDPLGYGFVDGAPTFSSVVSVPTALGGTLSVICNSPSVPGSSGY